MFYVAIANLGESWQLRLHCIIITNASFISLHSFLPGFLIVTLVCINLNHFNVYIRQDGYVNITNNTIGYVLIIKLAQFII